MYIQACKRKQKLSCYLSTMYCKEKHTI